MIRIDWQDAGAVESIDIDGHIFWRCPLWRDPPQHLGYMVVGCAPGSDPYVVGRTWTEAEANELAALARKSHDIEAADARIAGRMDALRIDSELDESAFTDLFRKPAALEKPEVVGVDISIFDKTGT